MGDQRPGANEFVAAGLYNPDSPDAADRLALLEYLVDIGATIDDFKLVGAYELPALASTLGLFPDRNFLTIEEVSERTGIDPETIQRMWRAAGFPDAPPGEAALSPAVVELYAGLSASVEFFGEEQTLNFIRVLGASAARIADAAVTMFVVNAAPAAVEADPSFVALARANHEATAMLPMVIFGFDLLLRYHMHNARRFEDPPADGVEVQYRSVGFVDLVGSTQLAVSLGPKELADAFALFDATAADIITANGGRMVKLIGDEVMFAAPDPTLAARIAVALIAAFTGHDLLPPVRAAIATGDVIARDGDYSGTTVNRAARAVKLARPGSLLADEATASALADAEFAARFVRAFSMKGFDDRVKLWRIRRFTDPRDQSAS